MLPYLILGGTFAFGAAVQPGPLQAYLFSQALAYGWRRTMPAALSPLVSDGPIIALVVLVLTRLPARFEAGVRCGGGIFLIYLAVNALRSWRRYTLASAPGAGSARRSLLRGTVVNLLNPNPYLGWSLVLGPLLLAGWREAPSHGIALLVGFYGTMVATLAGLVAVFAHARRFGPRVARGLLGLSAIALACFGCTSCGRGSAPCGEDQLPVCPGSASSLAMAL
jgi:threonine/homoserine/homoserine lactone efflux protein